MKPVLVVKSSVQQQYLDYLEGMMYNTHPGFHSMRVQPAEYSIPAEARELTTSENVNFKDAMTNEGRDTRLPLSITELGHTEPLRGRHVYPFSAFSMQPNLSNAGVDADLPRSYKLGRQNKLRDLQMYGFEGKGNTPQRYANNAQTEGIIYGDVDESQITPIMAKPFKYEDMRHAARSLQPTSGYTPADLPQKRQKMARELMDMGVPPLLMDEHIRPQNISDPSAVDNMRDDTRQWSQNQQRLNIPTEDLLHASEPMDIAMRLLKDNITDEQHAPKNDPRFWGIMDKYGKQNTDLVNKPFYPYSKELGEMTPQVDELIASHGYKPFYFGGRFPMADFSKKNYKTGHLGIYDPGQEATSFGGNQQFTGNWRKLHELGHAQGLDDLNTEWGEGRRLGKVGARTPREMLRAVDWETYALANQRKLMDELGLPVSNQAYNRDWNTTIGDAGFRAITGQFTSPESQGFEPFDEKISQDHAMNAVRTRAEELGLDMDETLRDKRGGSRKVASEPMDIAMRFLKEDNSWDDEFGYAYDKNDPHTHKCKHCDYPIYHHLQQGGGDGSDPPQEVWSGDEDEGGNCSSPSGFCEPGESLGKTYQSGQPIEATPESHPNRIWLNGRWVDANDWTDEHTAEEEEGKRQFQVDSQMVNGNWHDTWDWNKDIHTGEPMEIAMQLLKERVSPEAKRHKLEYDKKYESSPERVKYREDLNRERRRRGIYGSHDHKDISHTEGGKLTLEGEHENRARHFKDKGTLREL